jgi:cupin 2 domain-containing protein
LSILSRFKTVFLPDFMKTNFGNILTDPLLNPKDPESFEELVKTNDLLIERIVTGKKFQTPGPWYDQNHDEWVLMVKGIAELEFENNEIIRVKEGDYIFIPAKKRHRVRSVKHDQDCIWLAIHGNFK